MYLVMQCSPREQVIFASNSQDRAGSFFHSQVKKGKGWFELWEEGKKGPLQAGGKYTYRSGVQQLIS